MTEPPDTLEAASPLFEASYDFTPALGRAVFRAYFWQRYLGMVISSFLTVLFSLALLGSRDLKLLAVFLLGFVAALWVSWWRSYMASGRQAEGLPSATVRVSLSDDGCRIDASDARVLLLWQGIRQIHRLRPAWLLERGDRSPVILLPTPALVPEAAAFLERKVREAGGRVR